MRLSAGAKSSVCPFTHMPVRCTAWKNSAVDRSVRNPGMASSLSIVPPVKPRPRPLIFAMGMPQAAAIGPIISVVLSPTPPVLCLSTLIPLMAERSFTEPESLIASVIAVSSLSLSPVKQMAISMADIW